MRKLFMRLSALVTVIGISLLTVVILQGGLGKFSLPKLSMGFGTKNTTAKAPDAKANSKETADPFGPDEFNPDETKTATAKSTVQEVPNNSGAAPAVLTEPGADEINSTTPRTKPRALSFKTESEDAPTQLAPVDESTGSDHPAETSEMVGGAIAGKRGTSNLTNDEEDPFTKHKQAAAAKAAGTTRRAPASQSGTGIDSENESIERQSVAGSDSNPFDQEGAAESETVSTTPAVGGGSTGRNASRAKLIADGSPAVQSNPAITDNTIDQQPSGKPAEEIPPQAQVRAKSTGNRPEITHDAAFMEGAGESAAPSAIQARPKISDDNDGPSQRPPFRQGDAQPIPRRVIDQSEAETPTEPVESSEQLTPPVAKSGGRRPNPLLDEGDEPTVAKARPASVVANPAEQPPPTEIEEPSLSQPGLTDSAIPIPNTKRPSRHVLEIEPDSTSAGTERAAQPMSAASRSTATDILANPRVAATSDVPGILATNPGRGRVTIEKVAPPTAYIGQPLIYQIRIKNIGDGAANQVVVEDIVPDTVTMQGSIPQAELVGKKLSWRLGCLKAGEEQQISVKIIPNAEGAVGSAATVNFIADSMTASLDEPQPTAQTPGNPITPVGAAANSNTASGIGLELSGPNQVALGQPFEIQFRITNRTLRPFNDLIIRKMLPDGLQHQSRIQDLEYRVGNLGAGETREVTMSLTASQPGKVTSRAILMTSDARVLNSRNYSLDVFAAPAAGNSASRNSLPLTIERIGTARPSLNKSVTYANRVTNRGTQPTAVLRIVETLPLGMEFESAENGGRYDQAARKIVWEVPPLEPNTAIELKVSVIVRDTTPQVSSIVVADNQGNQSDTSAQVIAGN